MPITMPKLFKEISVFSDSNTIDEGIRNAAKVATNFITLGSDGIKVADGPHQQGSSGVITYLKLTADSIRQYVNNILRIAIDPSGMAFKDVDGNNSAQFLPAGINLFAEGLLRNTIDANGMELFGGGSLSPAVNPTSIAKFTASLIELGKNSLSSVIKFCSGAADLTYRESAQNDAGSVILHGNPQTSGNVTTPVAVGLQSGNGDIYQATQANVVVTTGNKFTVGDTTVTIGDSNTKSGILGFADRVLLADSTDPYTQYFDFNMNDIIQTLIGSAEISFGSVLAGSAYNSTSHKPFIQVGTSVLSRATDSISFGNTFTGVGAVLACFGDDVNVGNKLIVDNVTTTGCSLINSGGSNSSWRANWIAIGWVARR